MTIMCVLQTITSTKIESLYISFQNMYIKMWHIPQYQKITRWQIKANTSIRAFIKDTWLKKKKASKKNVHLGDTNHNRRLLAVCLIWLQTLLTAQEQQPKRWVGAVCHSTNMYSSGPGAPLYTWYKSTLRTNRSSNQEEHRRNYSYFLP